MKTFSLLIIIILTTSCASKTVMQNSSFYNEPNGVELKINWIKNKGDALDLSISARNNYPHAVVIQENSVEVSFAGIGMSRAIKGNPRWVLRPGDMRSQVVIFEYGDELPKNGTGKIIVRNIYNTKDDTMFVTESKSTSTGFTAGRATSRGNRASGATWSVDRSNTTGKAYNKKTHSETHKLKDLIGTFNL